MKISLVTGGGTGIGFGIAKELVNRGDKVIVTSRKKRDLSEYGISCVKADISSKHGLKVLISFLKENNYKINILVNNIGHTLEIKDPYCDQYEWERIINLNLYTAINMTNIAIKDMSKKDYGRIVNISSNAGIENSGPVTFTVSKAALTAYTRSMGRVLATEYKNIVMSAILPGIVITEEGHWKKIMNENPVVAKEYISQRCPLSRFGEINEITKIVRFLTSEDASFFHGSIIPVDGGQAKGIMSFNYM